MTPPASTEPVPPQPKDPISHATMLILNRIGEQGEFKEVWKNLPNAERSYLCGDIYNIIEKNTCARGPVQQAPAIPYRIERDGFHFVLPGSPEQIISLKEHDAALIAQEREKWERERTKKPGCYNSCPFDDLCANDIEKIQEIERMAAAQAREDVLKELQSKIRIAIDTAENKIANEDPSLWDYSCREPFREVSEWIDELRSEVGK